MNLQNKKLGGFKRRKTHLQIDHPRVHLHLRAMMTELVWRLRKFQPQWRGFVKFAAILGPESKAGRPARKKAITACVPLLFIDLWRLFTGQLQASAIGLN